MKTILLITAISLTAFAAPAQENGQAAQQKDQNRTTLQENHKNSKNDKRMKSDSTRKMSRTKKEEKSRKMDNYPSNREGNAQPAEQQHMDSSINNHR